MTVVPKLYGEIESGEYISRAALSNSDKGSHSTATRGINYLLSNAHLYIYIYNYMQLILYKFFAIAKDAQIS